MIKTAIEKILDHARWAPSGDNAQCWRFELIDEERFKVRGFDTRHTCVYDFKGRASQIALGALLENIVIAATELSLAAKIGYCDDSEPERPVFDVHLHPVSIEPDPLLPFLRTRSVQRRPYSTEALAGDQLAALTSSLGEDHTLLWLDSLSDRLRMAELVSRAGKLRLTIPEAYAVHREAIAWNSRFSPDKVPDQAIGLDKISLKLMRRVLVSWERVEFFNTYLAGTLLPRIQLDIIPALRCAGHFMIMANSKPVSVADYVAGGRAVQRFWLTATRLGLQLQPEMSPLIFSSYASDGVRLSSKPHAQKQAENIRRTLQNLAGNAEIADRIVFMGRIGKSSPAAARSTRRSVQQLTSVEKFDTLS
ncbi:MAG TPA: molybdopterin biosynthesis protein MoeY [Burkholderiales bacterium]|nr:molybdopterin biosynthesis protein MoeY [Burkholderiales bacterium]